MKTDELRTELINAYKAGFQEALKRVSEESLYSRTADEYAGNRVHRIVAETELLEKSR